MTEGDKVESGVRRDDGAERRLSKQQSQYSSNTRSKKQIRGRAMEIEEMVNEDERLTFAERTSSDLIA